MQVFIGTLSFDVVIKLTMQFLNGHILSTNFKK